MNEVYASGGSIKEGFWDAIEIPDSIRSAYGKDLKTYAENLNKVADSGEIAEAGLKGFNNLLLEQGQNIVEDNNLGETLISGLKSGGKALLSMAGNAALDIGLSMALQTGLNLLDQWINREQIAIDNGKEAKTQISNTFDEFSKGKNTITSLGKQFSSSQDDIKTTGDEIDTVAEKYVELAKGVNVKTNANIDLSDADYQSYIDMSNQLAELYPTLVSGYDNQGNAMLNLSSNAKIAADSLRDLYNVQMLSSNANIGQNLQQTYDGVMAQIKQYEKSVKSSNQTAEEATNAVETLQSDTTDYYNELITKGSIELDSAKLGQDYYDYYAKITNAIDSAGILRDTFSGTDST